MKTLVSKLATVTAAVLSLILSASPAVAARTMSEATAGDGKGAMAFEVRSLRNNETQRCLVARVPGIGAPIQQTPCNSAYPDQNWEVRPVAADRPEYVQLRNMNYDNPKLCLVVRGGAEQPATLAVCDKTFADQVWYHQYWGSGIGVSFFYNQNSNYTLCLVARIASNATHTQCNTGYEDQAWLKS